MNVKTHDDVTSFVKFYFTHPFCKSGKACFARLFPKGIDLDSSDDILTLVDSILIIMLDESMSHCLLTSDWEVYSFACERKGPFNQVSDNLSSYERIHSSKSNVRAIKKALTELFKYMEKNR